MRPTTSLPASVVCTAFKPFERNTLRGFADFQLTAAGGRICSTRWLRPSRGVATCPAGCRYWVRPRLLSRRPCGRV